MNNHTYQKLMEFGIRPTSQRLALAELLFGDGKARHFTAESLYSETQEKGYSISQATIYNTLHAFSQSGLIKEIAVEGHKSFFDTRIDEHPHYYHENSGKIEDAPSDIVEVNLKGQLPEGQMITGIDVVIRIKPEKHC